MSDPCRKISAETSTSASGQPSCCCRTLTPVQLPGFVGRLLFVTHEQYWLAGWIECVEYGGKNVRAHRAHNGQVETIGIKIAADVAAHQGKCRSIPFALANDP